MQEPWFKQRCSFIYFTFAAMTSLSLFFLWPVLMGIHAAPANHANLSDFWRHDRDIATNYWRNGSGLLWFQHLRRAGGTSLCHLLQAVVHAQFVGRGEACQPDELKLRDAHAVAGHNLSLLEIELGILGGNAFAQEYGPIPTQALFQRRMPRWVFVTSIRDPWARMWSQLRHEMAPCLQNSKALAVCLGGQHGLLGSWLSPTAHIDSILGVPGFRLSENPHVYGENYYTRVLVNRTDPDGPPLTEKDYGVAKSILFDRMSAVIVMEDFAQSALQLACALGLKLDIARSLLRTRVRPYQAHEAQLDIPTESELGVESISSLQVRFAKRNRFDYGLYHEAKRVSKIQVAKCAKSQSAVAELRTADEEVKAQDVPVKAGEAGFDVTFGCTNASIEEINGTWVLRCPRTQQQRMHSWWKRVGAPSRKMGQKIPGEHCWKENYQWETCCDESYGPQGNPGCWDSSYTYSSCCIPEEEKNNQQSSGAI